MQSRTWLVLALLLGTVVALPSASLAASFKVIHTFSGATDGVIPDGTMIFDAAGNLYGTTVGGGLYGGGTVFELSPDGSGNWTETILYSFKDQMDGGLPTAGLIFDAQGNLYGTTQQGGIFNGNCSTGCGVVFELSPAGSGQWSYKVLYNFTGLPDGALPNGPVVMDSAGNLFGTTGNGGIDLGCFEGCGTVFELLKANGWQEQVLHTFGSSAWDGEYPSGRLLLDSKGNLYGTTWAGGTNLYGTVYQVTPSTNGTWTETVLYSFCSHVNCGDGTQPSAGVIEVNGKLVGTAALGGGTGYYGTVFQLTPLGGKWWDRSYQFNITDGADPVAPVLHRGQRLYGVTTQGGIQNNACVLYPTGNGVVFEMAISNGAVKETVLYKFTGGSDGCGPVSGLVADAAGNLYGTTSQGGGGTNGGTVFEVTP